MGALLKALQLVGSELNPAPRIRFGLAAQRTQANESRFDIQRGLLLDFAVKQVEFTSCVINPDDEPALVSTPNVRF